MCNGANGTPNLAGRFLEGVIASPGAFKAPGLPNITGSYFIWNPEMNSFSGAFSGTHGADALNRGQGNKNQPYTITFNASKSNAIYGNSNTVQPASYTVYYIMKIK